MAADVLILGQGLAGTLLAWELERAGISFAIADLGPARAASFAGAGIINPITGRRLVKSWRFETLRPLARAIYGELEAALGVPLWRELRVRRLFADERERAVFAQKRARGELAPFVPEAADDSGFWIHAAARVDLRALLAAARARWSASGRLRTATPHDLSSAALVIDCTGEALAAAREFGFVPWEFSKGEILELAVEELAPDVVLNRRHWIAPVGPGAAWVGATHEPGARDRQPTAVARSALEASARELLGDRAFTVTGHRAGVRVNLPDKHPVAGRHPASPDKGVINGLGAKGALWAPMLAQMWAKHLTAGTPFDPEIDVCRFG